METKIIILTISAIINIFLGALIYSKGKKEVSNILFSFMTFFIALWSVGLLFFVYTQSLPHTIIWVKFYYIAASFIASVFLHFCLVFLTKKKLALFPVILTYTFPLVLVFVFFFSNFLIKEITIAGGVKEVKLNLFYYSIYGLWYLIVMGSGFFILFKKIRQSTDIEKVQIKYILSGTLISALSGMYFNLILPWIGNYKLVWIGPSTTLIMAVVMAYAITRHHIFNTKVIATETLTALMAIMLLVRIPLSKTPSELAFNLIFFHIFLVLGILLIRTVWQEIHRAQEVENLNKEKIGAYDKIANQAHNLQLLQKISDIILKSFGEKLPNLTQKVLNIAAKDISYCSTILIGLITEDKKYLQAYSLSENKFSTFILNHLDRPFQEHQIAIEGSESNLFLQSHLNKKLIAGNKFVDFVNPPVPRAIAELIQKALGIKSVVSFPVLKGNESVGIMGFMLNKPKEKITEEDYHLLKAMADEISLAIEKTTVYKELEQKIEDLKQINVDLQKLLDMKTEFMRVASHQLRTPISSVKGILSMLNEDGLPPEKREEFIKLAYESADKLSSIIKDILSATSLEAGRLDLQFQKTNITKVLEESVKERGLLVAGKPVKLNYKPPIDIPEIQADPYWMKEVFNNLIDNAIFYTPKGEVNIGVANQPANVAVTIQDTGVGITPEDKERLFNKFTRGQNAMSVHPNGSGLGLYIAKNIIDLHQGNINIESAGQDKGTTIEVELPK